MGRALNDIEVRGVISQSGTRYFEIKDGKNIGYVKVVDFIRSQRDEIAELVGKGFDVLGAKQKRLVGLIHRVENFEPVMLFEGVGHHQGHFVYPDGHVFSPSGVPAGAVVFTTRPKKCQRKGTLDGWLEHVASPLAGHAVCEFFLMMPFAGPLRSYTHNVLNFGFELVGDPACGKSVLLQMMTSTCGGFLDGEDGNFGVSFATTAAGLETEMAYYSDLIMPIDEGNLYGLDLAPSARGRAFSQLIMALAKGQEKQRYQDSTQTFRFLYATTSNEPLSQVVGGSTYQSVTAAVRDRLLTIPLAGRQFGIFDFLPCDFEKTADIYSAILAGGAENHGVAMPLFLQGLVDLVAQDRDAFVAKIRCYAEEFRREAQVDGNVGSEQRVADAFGQVYVAGRLAVYLGALPSTFDPMASALACYSMHKATLLPQPSPLQILRKLLDDPEIIDLDKGLREMSDTEFREAKGFLRTNKAGEIELLIPDTSIKRILPNWNQVRRTDPEVKRVLRREDDRYAIHRKVRKNNGSRDRLICFVLDGTR